MPPPPSYIDVTSFPFSRLVTQAEFNGGTYGGVANEVWFRYVGGPDWFGNYVTKGGTFNPLIRVYESDGSTLLYTGNIDRGSNVILPTSDTYYVRINRTPSGASDFDFTVNFDVLPVLEGTDVITNDILVNDDLEGGRSVVIRDGVLLGVIPSIPAGEIGTIIPSTGETLWHDRFSMYGASPLALFDSTLTYVTSLDTIGGLDGAEPLICASNEDFYVYDHSDRLVYKVTPAGVVTGITVNPLPVAVKSAVGVSRDGTILYWASGHFDGVIRRYDLINDVALTDLYTIPGFAAGPDSVALTLNSQKGDILVLSDGTVVTWWYDVSITTTFIIHLSAAGTLLSSKALDLATYGRFDHLSYAPDDPADTVLLWYQTNGFDRGTFSFLNLDTGVITVTYGEVDLFSEGHNIVTSSEMFGPAESCTMILFVAGTGAATLTVIKITDPTGLIQSFDFTTTGGLSPSTFSLADGEFQEFTDLAPGTYGITETPVDGFTTSYDVSNGDDPDAIELDEGDNVVVIVTNAVIANTGSGIYKIVPGKRNDTLWLSNFQGTEDVKIP